MIHAWLGACPALLRTVLDVEGFYGRMLDLRPVIAEVCSKMSGASCDRVLLDRLEELLFSD